MRRGFTIIELLVASLLLGIIVTILTMIFNQSSIAWRVGLAGTADLSGIRENVAEIREEADNVFMHDGKLYRLTGLWDKHGNLRNRACDAPGSTDENENYATLLAGGTARTGASMWITVTGKDIRPDGMKAGDVGSTSTGGAKTYTVNVMSGGPNNDIQDWESIWSFPYEFDE